MAPKKARFKPPIRPNADGTGFVRVSAGDTGKKSPKELGGQRHPDSNLLHSSLDFYASPRMGQSDTSAVELSLQIRSNSSLPSNEARLSPSSFRALGIVSGAVLRIVEGHFEAYAEAFLSSVCHSQTVELADEVAAAFIDKQVNVSVVTNPFPSVPLAIVVLEINCDSRDGVQAGETVKIPFLQVRAAFRRQYRCRLVYRGMRVVVRVATQPFYVEVVKCVQRDAAVMDKEKLNEVQVRLGLLGDCTIIRDGGREIPIENEYSENSQGSLKDKEALQHVLVVGESGTGKSRFLHQEGREATTVHWRHVETILVQELPQGEMSDLSTSTVLREAFARAKVAAPSTVLIDDLHLICGTSSSSTAGSLWAATLVAGALKEELDDIWARQLDVRVIASAASAESVDRSLLTTERFGKRVTLLTPGSSEERCACLRTCLEERDGLHNISEEALVTVAQEAHGFTQCDLARLAEVAMVESFKMTGNVIPSDDALLAAAKLVRPSALKQFEVSVPNVTWNDIGGSEEAKKILQDCVAWCLGKRQWIFRKFKLTPPRGVLLYGPPGCSKTMLAKALANESKMNFISVKGPEVFSKWVGDSEKAVRDIFTRARVVAPCVVFIDELDGMCGHRGRGGVSDRVISQFLTELDGLPAALDDNSDALVFVAATNRPDNIDTAVLRPGRIDRKVYVGLPDVSERRAIVGIHFSRIPVAPDLDADYVAKRTEGYSGAEVVAVVKEAAFLRVTLDVKAAHVTRDDVDAALQKVRPRISPSDVAWYRQWSLGGLMNAR
ncbi:AAA family ATPase-like protein [Trypanosoma rangeli]|uniref:AAA family ATPase-like protein n=1 Tax=Trypanosoma rangeli TaxID=5698 RepID=A0A3R7M308_TRYRA|nr:AAA family ATPase-like protein [Trypanosoma rangeli]RNE98473.1 AAA family ATPase-like protein [Trypanosoma rangeli]|eukprot:RNE98473.1 AAA family ATPase-like protein [Trypanosoma rangeli]